MKEQSITSDQVNGLRINEEVALLDIIAEYWNRRWTMFAIVFCTAALALVVSFIITPVYRATVLMVPVEGVDSKSGYGDLVSQLGGLASLAGMSLTNDAQTEEIIATLTSRAFSSKFIIEHDLMPYLFESIWDAENKEWLVDDPDDIPSLNDGFNLLDSSVRTIVRNPDTGLLSLNIDWPDPELAATWANQMVETINLHIRSNAINEAEKSIAYLNQELEKTSVVGTRNAIYNLVEIQIQNIMYANVRKEYAFKVIDPAVVLEEDDYFMPNRPLLVVLGLAFGLVLSVMLAFGLAVFQKQRQ